LDPIRISAKNLGQTALEDFCPRCYWIKLKSQFRLPFQTFPGIFSSIDAFTKHCIHYMIDNGPTPSWMMEIGNVAKYLPVPHHSKSSYFDPKSGITLTGAPDDIWQLCDNTIVIPDFKTQRWTDNQDKLFKIYEVQSNVYNILITQNTKVDARLCLIYMEPDTAATSACNHVITGGFSMNFNAKIVPVVTDKKIVRQGLSVTREIFEMQQPPSPRQGCKECSALDKIIGLLGMAPHSNAGLEE